MYKIFENQIAISLYRVHRNKLRRTMTALTQKSENELEQWSTNDRKKKLKSPSASYKKLKREEFTETFIADDEESPEEISKQYKRFINAPKFNLASEEVFCICRRPDHGGELMISCDGCDEWFHFPCMKLNEKHNKLIARFFCKFCRFKGIGETLWKRKCRLHNCWEPARPERASKYCSDEHGISYMRQNLLDRGTSIHDLKVHEVKEIIRYSDGDFSKLKTLGYSFPELPEVLSFKDDNAKINSFPQDTQKELIALNTKTESLQFQIDGFVKKINHLGVLREKIKALNELASEKYVTVETNTEGLSKSNKNGKQKGMDICFYDKSLSSLSNRNHSLSEFKTALDEDVTSLVNYIISFRKSDAPAFYRDTICVQERRKCLRHNGWWNLTYDELNKKVSDLTETFKKVEDDKATILRDYTIRFHESAH